MISNFDPFVAEWTVFANNPKFNLVEKCLKLSQILEYPNLRVEEYIQKINDIGESLKETILTTVSEEKIQEKTPTFLISILNQHLFDNLGFHGDEEDYYNPKNNFLNEVIDRRCGLPITLSILYLQVAKHVGLDLKIVGFPGHIIVKYDENLIVDPFYSGRLLKMEDLQNILDANFGGLLKFSPDFLNEIPDEKILVRITRNLKNSYTQSYDYDKAMRCVNMVLTVEPDSPEDVRDKGFLEERLMNHQNALTYLNRYLELSPNANDVDFVLEMIRDIRNNSNEKES
ncbi:MAG: tetratricopeptide repeat protein [Nitrosopumilaceae archaeon]|nr:tetratricopeptide repeat protein [Nitrosopumilaceae archaeon]NIT99445.1 tetratricopeptide repeat protein [Nitrosopumilaceae archaeon]NIU85804.1 tetratricopeptide repeat protein [Nitrosopumilaceae archaeon]NIV64661.1 tetratricopeptide repeat protein [Nitrosopumilaceae archaeon]NIX60048.1 tetratricopeptide repeat protein [Nitrosopumilaceae archaeon]